MYIDSEMDLLKITTEPIKLRITSEPYVVKMRLGYTPAVTVWVEKKKVEMRLLISASSLSNQLDMIRKSNSDHAFFGLEFWIFKESEVKQSKYRLEE